MKRASVQPFSVTITMGLEYGYTRKLIDKQEVVSWLQEYQARLFKEKGIGLSIRLSPSEIVFGGQVEPHLRLGLINYPKFPMSEALFKTTSDALVRELMQAFNQNRMVVEYWDETVMFENSPEIDPRIMKE
ncbi:hypothetical protein ACT29H_01075 [Thermophagus sp. OGC60D27]|uniref:hypothetical protein n=1 Tax=Thermophagus sp. OGC60D27 TaxID=3458415 RepID=UPI0040379924